MPRSEQVEATVWELLPEFGLVHLMTADGRVLGLRRETPGLSDWTEFRAGQRFLCEIAPAYGQVLHARRIE